jgi:hypothetical protein
MKEKLFGFGLLLKRTAAVRPAKVQKANANVGGCTTQTSTRIVDFGMASHVFFHIFHVILNQKGTLTRKWYYLLTQMAISEESRCNEEIQSKH